MNRAEFDGGGAGLAMSSKAKWSASRILGRRQEAADALTWVPERMHLSRVMWRAMVAADQDAALARL